ncbi:hypothetical protein V1514DRAFT_328581 [Lipomyces japonicus]|uniref:uncharacterized protein n=1 Tax=Lipomyces japonicus TaxID=56871 RepID=UPI0034CFF599
MYHHPPPQLPPGSPAAKRVRVDGPPQYAQGSPAAPHLLARPGPGQVQVPPGAIPGPNPPHPPPPPSFTAHQQLIMSLEDEDIIGATDDLDTISAREISASRYARHHEWMEQVLGSAYHSDKIIPPSLYKARNGSTLYGGIENLRQLVARAESEASDVEYYDTTIGEITNGPIKELKEQTRLARAQAGFGHTT